MKFLVSATTLANKLAEMSKVMSTKAARPILSSFLFELNEEKLHVTASDGECFQCSTIPVAITKGSGKVCLPADRLLNALKNLPDQLIGFTINEETLLTTIKYANGQFELVGESANEYSIPPSLDNIEKQIEISANILNTAISQTLFAVSVDDLRPIMNGVYFTTQGQSFQSVATDGQKLVRNTYKLESTLEDISFLLPTKAAKIIKSLTNKITSPITISHNQREALFTLENDTFRCRLLEGHYPNYNAVIPQTSPNTATIERDSLLSAIKRVGQFSSTANGRIIMDFSGMQLNVSGKDIDYSSSAEETLFCYYSGENVRIGFKGEYLKQILENTTSKEVEFQLGEQSRAAIIKPTNENEQIDNLALLIPVLIDN